MTVLLIFVRIDGLVLRLLLAVPELLDVHIWVFELVVLGKCSFTAVTLPAVLGFALVKSLNLISAPSFSSLLFVMPS